MSAPLKLYNNMTTQSLVMSAADPAGFQVPTLYKGDTLCIEFQLLERDPYGNSATPLLVVPVSNYTLVIGLFKSDGTTLAYQNTFTPDTESDTYSSSLSLNTAAITTLLTGATSATVIMQIQVTDSDGLQRTTYMNVGVTLYQTYLTSVTTSVPPSETPATESWVRNIFFPKSGTSGGDVKIMQSAGGAQFRFYVDEDGQPHFDRLT